MTNTKTDYTNSAQQRLIKVILALFGDVVHGLSPGAIAKSVGCSSPMVTRDLDNLASAGIAQRDEHGLEVISRGHAGLSISMNWCVMPSCAATCAATAGAP